LFVLSNGRSPGYGRSARVEKMEIRSITLFCEPDFDEVAAALFFREAGDAFGHPVQTKRVATTPFPDWWQDDQEVTVLVQRWQAAGADYVSLGPVQLRHEMGWLERLPDLLAVQGIVFAGAEIADRAGHVDLTRCTAVAGIIRRASKILENGFGNLYFAALANCPPGSPFFPVAFHGGGPARFALALESADLAVRAVHSARSLAEARHNLVSAIEAEAAALGEAATALAVTHNITFHGLDFSLAPYPTAARSLAGAMEALGLAAVGGPGSLFAAAFITEAIDRATFPRCGFSGLMLPVLEDLVLAQRAAEGAITVNDLLAYAAVCGVGLDTVPLPGDVSEAALTGILLDVAALACRLDKPLTARLMPLPGLKAGDAVHFDFPYFADSRVMATGEGVTSLLARPGTVEIAPRGRGNHE
jgi:uncharacterized protein